MTIHVVQQGETIYSIADLYKVAAERLIIDNGIINPNNLAVGQTIVIVKPLISYTIQEGDTLEGIASDFDVSVMQLLRNNPYLSDRQYIYPGETIVISFETNKISTIDTSGYVYSFINRDLLKKTLPFLTYVTVFNYRQTADGNIIDVDDQDIIDTAKAYGVAPIMFVSTQTGRGESSIAISNTLLLNDKIQDRMIDNIVNTLKRKGYYGLNQYFQFYTPARQDIYVNYMSKLSKRLKSEGFRLIITVTPRINIEEPQITFEKMDYSPILEYADALLFISYNWGVSYGPPSSATPINLLREEINDIIDTVPPDNVYMGLPVIGYDWTLPYVPGFTKANAIVFDTAIEIATEAEVAIQYSKIAEAAYYFYNQNEQELHNVWFKDARSIDAISRLVPEYGLAGLSVWNLMYYFHQLWLVLNNEYDINKIEELNK